MLRGSCAIREAYRDSQVACRYFEERFSQPLGALLHARQARTLQRIIREAHPRRVLEIAPGPARLTREVAGLNGFSGVALDSSAPMIAEARRQMTRLPGGPWRFIQGDAFMLPFRAEFDVVFSFRLIRHFDDRDRQRIYEGIRRVLKPGGVLVFDVVNEVVSAPLRRANPHEYHHFDALLRPGPLRAELHEAGLHLAALEGVQHQFALLAKLQVLVAPRSRRLARFAMEMIDRMGRGEPLEWIAICRRV